MADTPGFSTPKRASQSRELIDGLKDTPHSRGSGSHTANQRAHTRDDYAPYLEEDLQSLQSMTHEEAFQIILGLEETSWQPEYQLGKLFNEIVCDSNFRSKLSTYCQPTVLEQERYLPFVDLSNWTFGLLKEKLRRLRKSDSRVKNKDHSTSQDSKDWELLFCRNDPYHIRGSAGERSPDVLGLRRHSFTLRGLGDAELAELQPEERFHWLELLMFVEFKRTKKHLIDTLASQSNGELDKKPTVSPGSLPASSGEISSIDYSIKAEFPTNEAASSCTPAKPSGSRRRSSAQPNEQTATRAQTRVVNIQEDELTTEDEVPAKKEGKGRSTLPDESRSGDKRASADNHYSKTSSQSKKQKVDHSQGPDETIRNPDVQCASYALEMLSHGGLRSHVIGLLITDDKINLCYYDRSVIVKATSFSFITEPIRFVAMLYALSQFKRDQWGFDPAIEEPQYLSSNAKIPEVRDDRRRFKTFEKTKMKWNDETMLTFGKEVFHQHSIIGRGTCVLEADVVKIEESGAGGDASKENGISPNDVSGPSGSTSKVASEPEGRLGPFPIALKFSYVPKGRESEVEIVRKLRDLAFQDEESKHILDHLPLILGARDFPARGVQAALKEYFDERDRASGDALQHPTYEERVLRMTLQERLLPIAPLREKSNRIASKAKLAKIFWDIFICYQWVHDTGGILHRDISINNLMYREDSGRVSGVLIDYDMAVGVNRDPTAGQSSKQRTGTKPFMARGLLKKEPEPHVFRHDLESLFYCYLWMLLKKEVHRTKSDPTKTVHIHPLQHWEDMPTLSLGERKLSMIVDGDVGTTYREFRGHSRVCKRLLRTLATKLLVNRDQTISSSSDSDSGSESSEEPPTVVLLTFAEFGRHICGRTMKKLKGGIINAPYHLQLASLFGVV